MQKTVAELYGRLPTYAYLESAVQAIRAELDKLDPTQVVPLGHSTWPELNRIREKFTAKKAWNDLTPDDISTSGLLFNLRLRLPEGDTALKGLCDALSHLGDVHTALEIERTPADTHGPAVKELQAKIAGYVPGLAPPQSDLALRALQEALSGPYDSEGTTRVRVFVQIAQRLGRAIAKLRLRVN